MKTMKKKIPRFNSEKAEVDFWDKNDGTDFFEFKKSNKVNLSNLKPTTKMISIRLPESLIERLKVLANRDDIPYQSLIKILLSQKVNEAIQKNHR